MTSLITGVNAHIRGDMGQALETAYRSYVSKYCLDPAPPFDTYKQDFFAMGTVFNQARTAAMSLVASLGPIPESAAQSATRSGRPRRQPGQPVARGSMGRRQRSAWAIGESSGNDVPGRRTVEEASAVTAKAHSCIPAVWVRDMDSELIDWISVNGISTFFRSRVR